MDIEFWQENMILSKREKKYLNFINKIVIGYVITSIVSYKIKLVWNMVEKNSYYNSTLINASNSHLRNPLQKYHGFSPKEIIIMLPNKYFFLIYSINNLQRYIIIYNYIIYIIYNVVIIALLISMKLSKCKFMSILFTLFIL